MLRIGFVVALLWLLASVLSACQPTRQAPASAATAPPALVSPQATESAPPAATGEPVEITITADQITSKALEGNLLGDPATRQFDVILPPGYAASDKRYPVVYMLHAYEGDEGTLAWDMKLALAKALATGAFQDMIFVFPDASNALRGSMYLSSPTIGDYETYLAQELVDLVDSKYRTLPQSESRGIAGCWNGADGAMHLALRHPDIFSVVAGYSGIYDWSQDPLLPAGAMSFRKEPQSLAEFSVMMETTQAWIAYAAGAASNPDKPPFYLDMPFTLFDQKGQTVPEVIDRIVAADPVHDLEQYVSQPERLRAILVYHGLNDLYAPVKLARAFSDMLTQTGIEHQSNEAPLGNCTEPGNDYAPVLQFMADNLVFEAPTP